MSELSDDGLDTSALTTTALLRLYSRILSELLRRNVIRSRNAPVGDLAELLVALAYGGTLAPASEKSWDVRTADRTLQVKSRVIDTARGGSATYSPFRSWHFDSCVFVVLDAHTYQVVDARELSQGGVEGLSRRSEWVRGSRVTVAQIRAASDAVDVTDRLRAALETVDAHGSAALNL